MNTTLQNAARSVRTSFVDGPLARSVRGGLHKAIPPKHDLSPEQLARIAIKRYVANIKTVEALARTYGFEFYSYWQPSLWTKATLSLQEKALIQRLQSVPVYNRYE